MIELLRMRINDREGDAFTDEELEAEILFAMNKYDKDLTVETVPENIEYLILKLAQISAYYTLASNEAKHYKISVDGVSVSKADRVKNYLALAQGLEKEYNDIINSPNHAEVEIGNMKRYSNRVDRMVGGEV